MSAELHYQKQLYILSRSYATYKIVVFNGMYINVTFKTVLPTKTKVILYSMLIFIITGYVRLRATVVPLKAVLTNK